MSALPKSFPDRRRAVPRPTRLPAPFRPVWLIGLGFVQRVTTPLALGALALTVGAYTLTVYQWQAWNQADRELARLRQQERRLQFESAIREQELARAAENSPLVLWDPGKTIFLKPEPLPEKPVSAPPQPLPPPAPAGFPLAY